ncbi:MAG: ketoacyl-ACP synthase III [Deltaproteobacteria bacterium]|nr:ketoacyl-ACP synthase III [Deltaproteobacteria bacterium]
MRGRIKGIGSCLPEKVLTNADLEQMVDTDNEWIVTRTGIRERRIAAEGEATSDLAFKAAGEALVNAGVAPEDLDLIIVATTTPDFPFPSTAAVLQGRLGARRAAAFDLQAVCTGFVYALSTADQFIKSGMYRKVLVVGAEVLSRIIDWKDRTTCILFGDGAGAVVLEAEKGENGILSAHLHADGNQYDLLYVPGGGSRVPVSHELVDSREQYVKMKGNEVFRVAVSALESTALEALEYNGMTGEDIDLLVPHQANIRILNATAKKLGLPPERVVITVDRHGNTSSASIPLALHEAVKNGRVKDGSIILLDAFGGGFTWGSVLIRW